MVYILEKKSNQLLKMNTSYFTPETPEWSVKQNAPKQPPVGQMQPPVGQRHCSHHDVHVVHDEPITREARFSKHVDVDSNSLSTTLDDKKGINYFVKLLYSLTKL
jgi:hypothetical protein